MANAKDTESKASASEQDEFFDDATETFPGKEDLKDRLVAVWALERGQDKNAEGKHYPFVTSVTLVLDDGPDGWSPTSIKDGETVPNLVPSVKDEGPQEINLRWSTSGMVSRLEPRVGKTFKPMVGRINSRKNKTAGRSASWSIAAPTDEDKVIARQHADKLQEIIKRLETEANKATDAAAFDA
jgi:hypothetical protein